MNTETVIENLAAQAENEKEEKIWRDLQGSLP
jgi:hypothetical protein